MISIENMQDNEYLLLDLINELPDPTFVMDMEARIQVWNKAVEDLTGVAAQEIMGKGGFECGKAIYGIPKPVLADILLNPHTQEENDYPYIEWSAERASAQSDNFVPHLQSHLWAKASLLHDRAGNIIGVAETIRDITELKNARREISHNQRRIERLNKNMRDIVCEVDTQGRYVYISPSCRRILGYHPEELIGQSVFNKIHGSDKDKVSQSYAILMGNQPVPPLEFRHQHRNGQYIWLEGVASLLKENDEYMNGMVVTMRDISERIESEKRHYLASAVYSNITEGIIVTDKDRYILDINPACRSILGYSAGDIAGTSLIDYIAESELEDAYSKLRILDSKGYWSGEIGLRHKSGHRISVFGSISVFRHTVDDDAGYVVIFIDHSEQTRFRQEQEALRDQLARVRRLASLNAMSAGIVHEIAQPVNTIKVLSDGLLYWRKRGKKMEIDTVMRKVENISRQVERVEDIIDHIRSFTSMNRSIDMQPFGVNDGVREALQIMGRQLANHEISLQLELAEGLPPVLGNQKRLVEAIVNLLANAMYELDRNNPPEKVIECSSCVNNGFVILRVRDSGPGIIDGNLERIFDPFFSTKENRENMGLGLAIVQSIVASFDGHITVSNVDEGGACFAISLPVFEEGVNIRE